jgi:HEAT repeat protein
MAVSALGPDGAPKHFATLVELASDPSEPVRTAAAEQLGFCGRSAGPVLAELGADPSDAVREAVATAYGERSDPDAVEWLITVAGNDENRQVREAAVAALGSIGDPSAIEPLLQFIASGPPQVRRRAIAAITVFDDPRIEPAIRRAALDRNPGVKEAAEMVVGRQILEG